MLIEDKPLLSYLLLALGGTRHRLPLCIYPALLFGEAPAQVRKVRPPRGFGVDNAGQVLSL